jgi:hypothetical protein
VKLPSFGGMAPLHRSFVIWAAVLAIGFAAAAGRSLPHTVVIPDTGLALDQPSTWHAAGRDEILDPEWARRNKREYPDHAAMIDDMVERFASNRLKYYGWIDVDGVSSTAEGWVEADAYPGERSTASLASTALTSVTRQPMNVRPGSTAIDVALPAGPAARLDWSYDRVAADGAAEVVFIRSYWIGGRDTLVVIQLMTAGAQPGAVSSFDAVAATARWVQ